MTDPIPSPLRRHPAAEADPAVPPAAATAVVVVTGSPADADRPHHGTGRDTPPALVPVLGRSPLQRHWGHLARLDMERCVVLVADGAERERIEAGVRRQLDAIDTGGMVVSVEPAPESGGGLNVGSVGSDGDRPVLWIRGEGVYDHRLYRTLLGARSPTALTDRDHRGASTTVSVGMALGEPGAFPEAGAGSHALPVEEIPRYLPSLRRHLRPYWCLVRTPGDRRRAADMLLDSTQKGVLDFPARFLHPPLENALTRVLAGTAVTPNQVTVFTGVLGFAAAALFAAGVYWPGFVLAFLVNVLDGVDGKLARVKLLTSRFGDRLDHTLDVLFEFAWYLGLGWGLSGGGYQGRPFVLAVGLIGVMLGSRAMSGVYKLVTGRQIHDHRAFDRAFRLVAGRRNVYVMLLVVGLLVGRLPEAFVLCFAWGVLTLVAYTGRTVLEAVGRGASRGGAKRPA